MTLQVTNVPECSACDDVKCTFSQLSRMETAHSLLPVYFLNTITLYMVQLGP